MSNYKTKLHHIKGLAVDVDGVLTDGLVLCTSEGDLLRTFDSKDGLGMRIWLLAGYPLAVITGGESPSITHRAKRIGIPAADVYECSRNKMPDFLDFCRRHGLRPEEVAYVGDDLPDIPVLQACGLAVCPSDAVTEVKAVCDYVSLKPGGRGCVRELIEQILKVHGRWGLDTEAYASPVSC